MKVLYLSGIPAPYRVDLFNEMGKTVQLTVVFLAECQSERNEAWQSSRAVNFQAVFLNCGALAEKRFDLSMVKYLRKHAAEFDVIVLHGYSPTASVLAAAWMKQHGVKYGIEADGAILPPKESFLKSSVKGFCIGNADFWLASGEATVDFFVHYGAKREKCYRYPFTSVSSEDINKATLLNREEKKEIRSSLHIPEETVIITVGRFSYQGGYGKGYDLLMQAAEKTGDSRFGFYFIGDQPTREFVDWKADKKLDHVHFIDFVDKTMLHKYYACADVFVLLTRGDVWGLAVNEAMVCGLPVVTTTKCLAGLELVKNGENGYLVDVDAPDDVFGAIDRLIHDEEKQAAFGKKSREIIARYTLENSSEVHIDALSDVVEGRTARSSGGRQGEKAHE